MKGQYVYASYNDTRADSTIILMIPEELQYRTTQTALPWDIPEKGGGVDRTGRTRTEQALCEAQTTPSITNHRILVLR
jgi:hypothetical protein